MWTEISQTLWEVVYVRLGEHNYTLETLRKVSNMIYCEQYCFTLYYIRDHHYRPFNSNICLAAYNFMLM